MERMHTKLMAGVSSVLGWGDRTGEGQGGEL